MIPLPARCHHEHYITVLADLSHIVTSANRNISEQCSAHRNLIHPHSRKYLVRELKEPKVGTPVSDVNFR